MYKKITSILLTLALILGMMSSALPVFAEGEVTSYTKVNAIEAGKTYVITAEGMGMTATAHGGYTNNTGYSYSGFAGTEVTVADNKITSTVTEGMLWTAEAVEGGFAFKNVSNDQYLGAFYNNQGKDNGIEFSTEAQAWSFNGTTLMHLAISAAVSNKDYFLTWDNKVSGSIQSGSANLFTIRSSGDTVTLYLAELADTEEPGGSETPDIPDVPETPDVSEDTFTKVNGIDDGKTYVITAEGMGMTATAHGGYTNNTGYSYSGFAGTAVTVADNKITSTVTEGMLWTAEAVTGGYSFKNVSNDQYLSAFYVGRGANGIEFSTTAQAWTLSGAKLQNSSTSKYLTWDNNVSGITDGSDDFFTIRSNGDDIIFYLAELAEEDTCQHDWADATCTAPKTCTVCGETEGEALDHTEDTREENRVEATCNTAGSYDLVTFCSVCKEVLDTESKVIDATGEHDFADATCTAPKTCTVCGETDGDALPHTEDTREENRVEATCIENGSYDLVTYCTVCDTVIKTEPQVITATGEHDFADATCTAPKTCTVCGETDGDALPHTEDTREENRVEATCIENGSYDLVTYCTVCDTVIKTEPQVITATGEHDFADATCTAPKTCNVCGETDGDALPHTEDTREENRVEATCIENGSYNLVTYCTVCDTVIKTEPQVITASGEHDFADATCTAAKTCKACGETEGEALGHNIVVVNGTAATCTESGMTDGSHCSRCDDMTVNQEEIPALGHDMILDVVNDATCTQTGLASGSHCSRCDEVTVEEIIIPVKDHTEATREENRVEATCNENGSYDLVTYCTVCETDLNTEAKVISATGKHNYESEITTSATCIAEGIRTFTCTVCAGNYTEPVEIDPANHTGNTEILDAAEATCSEDGFSGNTHCADCGAKIEDGTSIPATGEHNFETEVERVDSTCSTAGYVTMACACGETEETALELDADNHETSVVIDAKEPTCTEAGRTEGKYCSACNKVFESQDPIDALGHETVVDEAVAPTCENTGLTEGSHCSRCEEVLVAQDVVPALGHKFTNYESNGDATCTADGTKTAVCENEGCNSKSTITEENSALGHDIVTDAAIAPTCTQTGLTEGSHCSRCDEATVEQKVVDALGHDIVTDAAKAPTCTETGLTEGSHCSRCDEATVEQTVVDALGHTEATREENRVEATCETAGSYNVVTYCTVCSTDLETEENTIPATGHNWGEWVTETPATCTATGIAKRSCQNDSTHVEENVLAALGHDIVTDAAKAPTCTESGLTEGSHCSRCNEVFVAQTTVAALGHVPVTDAAIDPTCTATGLAEGSHCSRCNTVLVEQTVVDALGHDWQEATEVLPELCARCGLSRNVAIELIITADKETAAIGDTITYTVSLGPVYMLDGIEFKLDIPEGLTFKGGELVPGLQQTLNAAACNFNADKMKVAIAGGMAYTNAENTTILTFTCTVDKDFYGDVLMSVDTDNWYFEDVYHAVDAVLVNDGSKVNVPCTHPETTVHTAVASSCTTPGHAEYSTCNQCGIIVEGSDEALELDPENHVDVTVHAAVAGTCLVPGHGEYTTCNECGVLVSGSTDEVIDPHGNSRVAEDDYIKTEATCTTAAVYYMSCEHCGEKNTTATFTSGEALGHDMVTVPGVAPTCTESGLTDGEKCSRCDEATTQTVIPATGHAWTEATCTTAKTCTNCQMTDGEALGHTWTDATCTAPKTCTVCNETEGEALAHTWADATCTTAKTCTVCQTTEGDALGHNITVLSGKAATCTEAGLTEGEECSRCDYKKAQETIPALGHTWADATCTAAKTCTVCNATDGTALGHDMVKDEAVAPTCTTVGYTEGAHCSRCSDQTVAQKEIPALGHDITKVEGYAATCTEVGLSDGETCSRCDYEKAQDVIPALGHDMTTVPGYEATCTNTGLTDGEYCSRCDAKTEQKAIPALGHAIVTVAGKAPTCTETGISDGSHCSRCNAVIAEQTVVAALGHDMVKDEAVEPTCTETGLTEGAHCSRCSDETVPQQTIEARGHNFADATCTAPATCKVCGATEGAARGHKANDATCTEASVCEICGETVSEANGHRWADATCTAPQTCTVCGETQGEALGHKWIDASYDTPKTCERCGAVDGDVLPAYKVSGTVTSFGSATDEITIVLTNSEGKAVYTITTIGNNATYFINDVKSGTYTMLISKNGHATRAYTVTVGEADVTLNAAITLLGDINFDGKVNIIDNNIMYNHILEETAIADEYAMQCADMNGDGKIDIIDNNLLYDKVMSL